MHQTIRSLRRERGGGSRDVVDVKCIIIREVLIFTLPLRRHGFYIPPLSSVFIMICLPHRRRRLLNCSFLRDLIGLKSYSQVVVVAAISLETADLTPDSVDKILAHKSVKEKQAEYTNKLDTLRKKKRKEMGKLQEKLLRTPSKPKNPLGMIKKKFSTPNLESSLSASPPSATPEEVEMKPTLIY